MYIHGPPSEFSTYVSDAPADQSHEVLEIGSGVGPRLALSEHDPCLVGGTVTLDDVSFTTKLAVHSGGDAIVPYRYVVLLDTGFPQNLHPTCRVGSYAFGRRRFSGVRVALQPSFLGWFWRICPFADLDQDPHKRPIFPRQ